MTQNHQTALKCASLVDAGIQLLKEISPVSKKGRGYCEKLGVVLEGLKVEHQRVIDRAERKQLRREIREKMKTQLSSHGGDAS